MATTTQRAVTKTANNTSPRVSVDIMERLDFSTSNVDRKNFIIKNVKILGKTSPNRHGMDVEGTDYLPCAHRQAKSLYEGMQVNVGHPPRSDPDQERDPDDRNGVLKNVRIVNDETFGDWKLIPSHPITQRFLDCASDPDLHNQFALSHNAKGYGSVREGRYQISEIPKVRGVDVVCNGGTNKSLFESRDPMKTKKFKNVLESALQSTRDRFKPLLELYEEMGEMPAGDVAPPPADMPADDKPATDYMAHLGELVKAIVMNEELTPELKTEKIMAAIKVMEETKDEPTEAGAAEEVAEGDEEPGKKEGEEDEAKMESRERANAAKEKLIGVRDLCESLEFHETPIERKMLAALSTAEQKEWIKAQKAARGPGKKITVPRTATGARDVQESRAAGAVGNNFNDTSEEARAARVRDWKH